VLQVTNEAICTVGESQGITPKEPLEGGDANTDHAQPELGKSILATQETGVEESNAGDHNPDEGGGSEDPGDVTEVEDGIVIVMGDKVGGYVIVGYVYDVGHPGYASCLLGGTELYDDDDDDDEYSDGDG